MVYTSGMPAMTEIYSLWLRYKQRSSGGRWTLTHSKRILFSVAMFSYIVSQSSRNATFLTRTSLSVWIYLIQYLKWSTLGFPYQQRPSWTSALSLNIFYEFFLSSVGRIFRSNKQSKRRELTNYFYFTCRPGANTFLNKNVPMTNRASDFSDDDSEALPSIDARALVTRVGMLIIDEMAVITRLGMPLCFGTYTAAPCIIKE